jgi:hypothetical protein
MASSICCAEACRHSTTTVAARAFDADIGGEIAPVAALRSIVGFKRLADRPRDRNDLEELEAFHGELPIDPIPGLDT